MNGTYTLSDARPTPGPIICPYNHAYASIGLILADTVVVPHQLLWYSVIISSACAPGPDQGPGSDFYFCRLGITQPDVGWYWTGSSEPHRHVTTGEGIEVANFALNDVMPSFGYRPIDDRAPHDLSFDLLTRLKAIITGGQHGIDRDPSHWRLSVANYGQANWGGTSMATTWRGFIPTWAIREGSVPER